MNLPDAPAVGPTPNANNNPRRWNQWAMHQQRSQACQDMLHNAEANVTPHPQTSRSPFPGTRTPMPSAVITSLSGAHHHGASRLDNPEMQELIEAFHQIGIAHRGGQTAGRVYQDQRS